MILGIMQPYFCPYIGYWQLLNAVDKYVVYDNIQYSKKGWINRNMILANNGTSHISIPIKKDSDYLDIRDRFVSGNLDKSKLLNQIRTIYKNAPHFKDAFELMRRILLFEDDNLFSYIYNSIKEICSYLSINTELIVSSTIEIDHSLKGEKKVLSICKKLMADTYYNAIGGIELYDKDLFKKEHINLFFVKTQPVFYKQFSSDFRQNLSIIDVLMFNSVEEVQLMLSKYELL